MRFTAFAFTTLAATALASPIAQSYSEDAGSVDAASPVDGAPSAEDAQKAVPSDASEALPSDASEIVPAGGAPEDLEDVDEVVPDEVTSVVAQQPGATDAAEAVPEDGDAKTVETCEEVIALLEQHVEKIEGRTGSISTLSCLVILIG